MEKFWAHGFIVKLNCDKCFIVYHSCIRPILFASSFVQLSSLLFINHFHAQSTFRAGNVLHDTASCIQYFSAERWTERERESLMITAPFLHAFWVVCSFFGKQPDDHHKLYVAWDLIFTVPRATNYRKIALYSHSCILHAHEMIACVYCTIRLQSIFCSFEKTLWKNSYLTLKSREIQCSGTVPFQHE